MRHREGHGWRGGAGLRRKLRSVTVGGTDDGEGTQRGRRLMKAGAKGGWAMQSEVWLRGKLEKSLQCGEVNKTH